MTNIICGISWVIGKQEVAQLLRGQNVVESEESQSLTVH